MKKLLLSIIEICKKDKLFATITLGILSVTVFMFTVIPYLFIDNSRFETAAQKACGSDLFIRIYNNNTHVICASETENTFKLKKVR